MNSKKQSSNYIYFLIFILLTFFGKLHFFMVAKLKFGFSNPKYINNQIEKKTSTVYYFLLRMHLFWQLATGRWVPHPRHPAELWRPLALEMSVRIPTFRGIFAITMPSSRAVVKYSRGRRRETSLVTAPSPRLTGHRVCVVVYSTLCSSTSPRVNSEGS